MMETKCVILSDTYMLLMDMTKTRNGLGKQASKQTGKNLPETFFSHVLLERI